MKLYKISNYLHGVSPAPIESFLAARSLEEAWSLYSEREREDIEFYTFGNAKLEEVPKMHVKDFDETLGKDIQTFVIRNKFGTVRIEEFELPGHKISVEQSA
ncbi:hypothetical protein IMZ31_22365 (plasmid) [Pontibacillus sp. ALD_SL1]|uniref:hypothetical protein n=1 Tax=Pontibacillus sp. ALD_SL1 TaxID=2777185 RepID=UPI001A9671D0|nr:hypothetical protein [Pontibacillus sp. ALD_SL1]QST02200.1 hypothetical protein IMZ31_22365 [Pontibacillus sp. ALD_SL1]